MRELTQTQRKALEYVVEYLLDHEKAPTQTEIKAHMGYSSPHAVTTLLNGLEKKRYIRIKPKCHRGIVVLCPP
jgi:SOS-response transcriptional repressor LexA